MLSVGIFLIQLTKWLTLGFSRSEYSFQISGSVIIGCVANHDVIVITLENKNLFIIETNSGKHVLPPLVLSAKASHLLLTDKFLLCITCTGLLNLWDIDKLKVIVAEKSLMPILSSTQGTLHESDV